MTVFPTMCHRAAATLLLASSAAAGNDATLGETRRQRAIAPRPVTVLNSLHPEPLPPQDEMSPRANIVMMNYQAQLQSVYRSVYAAVHML